MLLLTSLLSSSPPVAPTAVLLPFSPPQHPATSNKTCTVTPLGGARDDVPQILEAFASCNNGGTVVFPEASTYHIATRLNPVVDDVTVEWRGTWLVC